MVATAPAGVLPLSLRPNMVVQVEIPWPFTPAVTKRGKPSLAKRAGKPIPWLSKNVVDSMIYNPKNPNPRVMYGVVHRYKLTWHAAATAAAEADGDVYQLQHHVEIEAQLYRNPANVMDPAAIVEGLKVIVDAIVEAGVLRGDTSEHVSYSHRSAVHKCPKGEQRVVLVLRRVS